MKILSCHRIRRQQTGVAPFPLRPDDHFCFFVSEHFPQINAMAIALESGEPASHDPTGFGKLARPFAATARFGGQEGIFAMLNAKDPQPPLQWSINLCRNKPVKKWPCAKTDSIFRVGPTAPETAFGLERSARLNGLSRLARRHGRGPLLWVLRSQNIEENAQAKTGSWYCRVGRW